MRRGSSQASAWLALASLLSLAAVLATAANPLSIDWQPTRAADEPWRLWTAAFVHYSALHLTANLAGAALVALLGWRAGLPLRSTLAWFIAWPLTQAGLWLRPDLLHYGGLSGVLHAGVAVVAVQLLAEGSRQQRWLGGTVLVAMSAKLVSETPWQAAVQHVEGWDIGIAPFAHVCGMAAGVLCGMVAEASHRLRRSTDPAHA
jgi:rhomboid family GlyGly-CTERM serine protease